MPEIEQITTTRYLTVKQVSEILEISVGAAYALVQRGEIQAIHVGRLKKITPAALQDYLHRGTKGPPVSDPTKPPTAFEVPSRATESADLPARLVSRAAPAGGRSQAVRVALAIEVPPGILERLAGLQGDKPLATVVLSQAFWDALDRGLALAEAAGTRGRRRGRTPAGTTPEGGRR